MFKRLVPGAVNINVIGSTCTALPGRLLLTTLTAHTPLTPLTTLATTLDIGPGKYCAPRHRMAFNSRNEVTRCVELKEMFASCARPHLGSDLAGGLALSVAGLRAPLPATATVAATATNQGLHSSTVSAQRNHVLWDKLGGVSLS